MKAGTKKKAYVHKNQRINKELSPQEEREIFTRCTTETIKTDWRNKQCNQK